ncbi:MAG: hypothetical protein KDG89_03685 [Geminicoccaceae bacterium]|nr:hypothetical protein [Geminicoccaceae bacterium]
MPRGPSGVDAAGLDAALERLREAVLRREAVRRHLRRPRWVRVLIGLIGRAPA